MYTIFDYNITQIQKILECVRKTSKIKITDTNHFINHAKKYKHCSYDLTYDLLKNHVQYDINFSEQNKFKVRYLHPKNEKYYICIIIFIVNVNSIRIITTHPEGRKNK
ncbi:MAG: hypothetical protein ACRC1M_00195 [Methanobacteriaceae archaeon]